MSEAMERILRRSAVIPVLALERLPDAVPLAGALIRGGLAVIEVTLRTDCALEAIAAMRAAFPEATIGAGTLLRPRDLDRCRAAGAQFAVTPGLTSGLLDAARRTRLALLPGVMTPSELIAAQSAGIHACKFFPAEAAGGIRMLQALQGPFPDQLFCPTGGITRENASSYLALANVACVGGSWVAPPDVVRAQDWSRVEALAREAAALRERAAPRDAAAAREPAPLRAQ